MTLIRYAGFDPTERECRPPMPHRESFVWRCMDAFDHGFDSDRIAGLLNAPEHAVVKAIQQGREARR